MKKLGVSRHMRNGVKKSRARKHITQSRQSPQLRTQAQKTSINSASLLGQLRFVFCHRAAKVKSFSRPGSDNFSSMLN
jgi:hypothetical protein